MSCNICKSTPLVRLPTLPLQNFNSPFPPRLPKPSGAAGYCMNDSMVDTWSRNLEMLSADCSITFQFRRPWPNGMIVFMKVDCKSAYYWQIHMKVRTALKSCMSINNLLLNVMLKMNSGGSPNQSQQMKCQQEVPFWQSQLFAVNYLNKDDDDLPRFDCYLDNILQAFELHDAKRNAAAIPLAQHLIGRPHDQEGDKSFPIDSILASSRNSCPKQSHLRVRQSSAGWLTPGNNLLLHYCRTNAHQSGFGLLRRSWWTGMPSEWWRTCTSQCSDDSVTLLNTSSHTQQETFHGKIVQRIREVELKWKGEAD